MRKPGQAKRVVTPPDAIWEPRIIDDGYAVLVRLTPKARAVMRAVVKKNPALETDDFRRWQAFYAAWYKAVPKERRAAHGQEHTFLRARLENRKVYVGNLLFSHRPTGAKSLESFARIARRRHPDKPNLSTGSRFYAAYVIDDDKSGGTIGSDRVSDQRLRLSLDDFLAEFPGCERDEAELLEGDPPPSRGRQVRR